MCNDLRKVKFQTERQQGFTPDLDNRNSDNHVEKRVGYFHCWAKEERKSEQSGLFREETIALIEEAQTGKIYHVDYDLFHFEV